MLFSWSVRTLYRHLLIMQFSEGSKLIPDYYHVIFEWTIKTLSIKLIFSNQNFNFNKHFEVFYYSKGILNSFLSEQEP